MFNGIKNTASIEKADKENLQNNSTIFHRGYQDAGTSGYRWETLPLSVVFARIDEYKQWAVEHGNLYFAGMAAGVTEIIGNREVVL